MMEIFAEGVKSMGSAMWNWPPCSFPGFLADPKLMKHLLDEGIPAPPFQPVRQRPLHLATARKRNGILFLFTGRNGCADCCKNWNIWHNDILPPTMPAAAYPDVSMLPQGSSNR